MNCRLRVAGPGLFRGCPPDPGLRSLEGAKERVPRSAASAAAMLPPQSASIQRRPNSREKFENRLLGRFLRSLGKSFATSVVRTPTASSWDVKSKWNLSVVRA